MNFKTMAMKEFRFFPWFLPAMGMAIHREAL